MKTLRRILAVMLLMICGFQLHAQVILDWSVTFGGSGIDHINTITVDPTGNIYTTGRFQDTVNFDPSSGNTMSISVGDFDIFVRKTDGQGNVLWVKTIGSAGDDAVNGFDYDNVGNIYLFGSFVDTIDFDPGPGTFTVAPYGQGQRDAYLLKLDPDGNFLWVRHFGNVNSIEKTNAVHIAGNGSIYLAGSFAGNVDFDPGTSAAMVLSTNLSLDVYILKLTSNGDFSWVKTFGGYGDDEPFGFEVNADETIYCAGLFSNSVDFDPGPNTTTFSSNGGTDIFAMKLDANGDFLWARQIGGTGDDQNQAAGVNNTGDLFLCGEFDGTVDFDPGPGSQLFTGTNYDVYVARFNPNGELVWARQLGGNLSQSSHSVAVDNLNGVYITGSFSGTTDFDPGSGTVAYTSAGDDDIFLEKLDEYGNFQWVLQNGGSGYDMGYDITIDDLGNIYTVGTFNDSVAFDPAFPGQLSISNGMDDGYIEKFGQPDLGLFTISELGLVVFPDPATDQFVVETSGKGNLAIYDLKGKIVLQSEITMEQTTIDCSGWQSGIYFVTVGKTMGKIIIQ